MGKQSNNKDSKETKRTSGGKKKSTDSLNVSKKSSSKKVQRKSKSDGTTKKLRDVIFNQEYLKKKLEEAAQKYGFPDYAFSDEGKDALFNLVKKVSERITQEAIIANNVRTKSGEAHVTAKDLEVVLALKYPELLVQ
jgi:hypothetical protein